MLTALLGAQVDMDQLQVELGQGRLVLRNQLLNPAYLNEQLVRALHPRVRALNPTPTVLSPGGRGQAPSLRCTPTAAAGTCFISLVFRLGLISQRLCRALLHSQAEPLRRAVRPGWCGWTLQGAHADSAL